MLTIDKIKGAWPNVRYDISEGVDDVVSFARAIEALVRAECVPPGNVVVPVEPTPEMCFAGALALHKHSGGDFDANSDELDLTYRKMIAAAPSTAPKVPA